MSRPISRILCILSYWLLILIYAGAGLAHAMEGIVVDAKTQAPIAGAVVRVAGEEIKTDEKGHFQIAAAPGSASVRAPGYLRSTYSNANGIDEKNTIALTPFRPKALYLSVYGIGDKTLRENALELISKTQLNALVIDVKGDRGLIPFPSNIALAHEIGAQKVITTPDMPALLAQLHVKGIYLIARIVVFKDNPLALAHPEFAVRDEHGQPWHDRESLAWVDPFTPAVWQYNLDIAAEAAQMGFDEIQFDYVRFPDAKGLQFSQQNTAKNRVAAVTGFLQAAKKRLAGYNVFVAADIFGYVCWNADDTDIGQQLEALAPVLDYISPMLYPSGFSFGIPGCPNPLADTKQIVLRTLQYAIRRTGVPAIRFRPWLQAFRDYAFDRRPFGAKEIRAQIDAAEAAGADGWMLWNPRNEYTDAGLLP
ncbi:hypothetical protein SAMN04515617_11693 [Collimonas sp. OK242]|nr:putative glycoside hydrolase [Collimonas sp. OK242]SDY56241.1 hypothetical protein SAMN04515617_11693 [Collimonas sp. OK242]